MLDFFLMHFLLTFFNEISHTFLTTCKSHRVMRQIWFHIAMNAGFWDQTFFFILGFMISSVARGAGGRVPLPDSKKIAKNREKEEKIGKREKSGKEGKIRRTGKLERKDKNLEDSFTLPLLTERAGSTAAHDSLKVYSLMPNRGHSENFQNLQGGPVKLDSMWQHRLTRPLHLQHMYYRKIFKQNPFNIISRGVQGCTSTDFRLK